MAAWVFISIGAVILVVMVGTLLYYDFRTRHTNDDDGEEDALQHLIGLPDKYGRWPHNPTIWK